jgi:Putative Zn-dependent protease, contains TPR repeats
MDAASGPSLASSMDAASYGPAQTMVHDRVARFFNRKYVRYEGKVHEQLTSTSSAPLTFAPLPLTFYHAGYRTMELKRAKTARNLPLLEAQLQEEGDNPYTLFQLGQSYFGLSDFAHALPYFERALEMDVNENEEYVQTLVESYGYCLLYLKQYAKALELEGVYPVFSKRADFVFLMGLVYMNNAMFAKAIREFQKATQIPVCCVEGVNSYSAYYNIGVIYECLGQQKEALDYYKKCGGYPPALERRGSLHENTIS